MGNMLHRFPDERRASGVAMSHHLRPGVAEDIGGRGHMEDFARFRVMGSCAARSGAPRGFFVVCDGHGGQDAARFTSENLLRYLLVDDSLTRDVRVAMRSSFLRADSEFRKEAAAGRLGPSGTTALAAVVVDSKLILAGAGDCRAILSRNGIATELTCEHKPDSSTERARIEAAGGFVDVDGYLNGDLAVSRAIGDFHLPNLKCLDGNGPLIADPEICEVDIGESEEFVVMSTDGVWMRKQTVVDIVRGSLRKHNCPEKASRDLVDAALKSDCHKDNITALIICLKPDPPARAARIPNSNSRLRINRDNLL